MTIYKLNSSTVIDELEQKIDKHLLVEDKSRILTENFNLLCTKLVLLIPANLIFVRSIIKTIILFFTDLISVWWLSVIILPLMITLWHITFLNESINIIRKYREKPKQEKKIIKLKLLSTFFDILALIDIFVLIFTIIYELYIPTMCCVIFFINFILESIKISNRTKNMITDLSLEMVNKEYENI